MSWENTLREEIKLSSPSMKVFYALWRKNERSMEKKLGLFSPPKFNGDIVQDLGVKSALYPLNIFFEGPFHNEEADDFFKATSEPGNWEIVHPVKGPLILQLISVKELMNPVETGNYTEFETSWIEPANKDRTISPQELVAGILSDALATIDDALIIFDQLKSDAYSLVQSSLNIFNKIAGAYDKILKEVASVESLAKDSYEAFRSSLNGFLDAYGIGNTDTADIGGAMTNMAIAATNSSTDFGARHTAFSEFIDEVFTNIPTDNTPEDYNKIVGIEFGVTIALIMIAQVAATSTYKSRTDVISAMESLIAIFNSTVAEIEAVQESFSDLDIDFQYFSQTKTYTDLINLFSDAMNYLIAQFYNLKIEKRFTLKTSRSPLEITVTEYGGLGENDSNYDLFLTSNKLTGTDILILPSGREVVIYA